MDAYSFLVSVLSFIVATLISWQIFRYVSFERRIKRIIDEDVTNKLTGAKQEIRSDMLYTHYSMLQTLLNSFLDTTNYSGVVVTAIEMLDTANRLNDKDKIIESLDVLDTMYFDDILSFDIDDSIENRLLQVLKLLVPEYDQAYNLLRALDIRKVRKNDSDDS